jgi:hypothetical protein
MTLSIDLTFKNGSSNDRPLKVDQDIFVHVFGNLDEKSLAKVPRVCKTFQKFSEAFWREKIVRSFPAFTIEELPEKDNRMLLEYMSSYKPNTFVKSFPAITVKELPQEDNKKIWKYPPQYKIDTALEQQIRTDASEKYKQIENYQLNFIQNTITSSELIDLDATCLVALASPFIPNRSLVVCVNNIFGPAVVMKDQQGAVWSYSWRAQEKNIFLIREMKENRGIPFTEYKLLLQREGELKKGEVMMRTILNKKMESAADDFHRVFNEANLQSTLVFGVDPETQKVSSPSGIVDLRSKTITTDDKEIEEIKDVCTTAFRLEQVPSRSFIVSIDAASESILIVKNQEGRVLCIYLEDMLFLATPSVRPDDNVEQLLQDIRKNEGKSTQYSEFTLVLQNKEASSEAMKKALGYFRKKLNAISLL